MQKIIAKYKSIFTTLFLAFFAYASISLAVHNFSHQPAFLQNKDAQILKGEQNSEVAQISKTDAAAIFSIVEQKNNNTQENHKASSGALSHCSLCFLSSFYDNIIFCIAIIFVIAAFYLFLIWQKSNFARLVYVSSSFSSRAPPFVS